MAVACFALGHLLDHPIAQTILGARHPENSAEQQVPQMGKIDVGLVKYDDFTGSNARTEFARPFGIVLARGVNDGKARQKTLQIQPQVALGRSLASPMLGPVHARDHQFDRGRVHDVDDSLETARQPEASPAREARLERLQMFQDAPEQLLGHRRIPMLVGMRKIVAAGRRRPTQRRERPRMQTQRVTDVVETQGVGQLRKEQSHDMAPGTKGAGFFIHPGFSGQLGHEVLRNPVAKLTQDGELRTAWLGFGFLFFHSCRVAGKINSTKLFLWDGCEQM